MTCPSRAPRGRIDQFFVPLDQIENAKNVGGARLEVTDVTVLKQDPHASDHLPVLLTANYHYYVVKSDQKDASL